MNHISSLMPASMRILLAVSACAVLFDAFYGRIAPATALVAPMLTAGLLALWAWTGRASPFRWLDILMQLMLAVLLCAILIKQFGN